MAGIAEPVKLNNGLLNAHSHGTLPGMNKHTSTHQDMFSEIQILREKLATIVQDRADLQMVLDIVTDHADSTSSELLEKLRQFNQQLTGLQQEKADLEISLETIMQHADVFERELLVTKKLLEFEVSKRTRELEAKNAQLEQEIQERKRVESELRLSASVFAASNEAIIITNSHARIVRVNNAFTALTGYTEAESLDKDLHFIKSGRHDAGFFRDMWEALKVVGYWSGEIWNRRKSEDIFPGWLSVSAVKNEQEEVIHYIAILTDNTHQKRSEQRIYQLCHYDALTHLPNRALFQERLQQALRRATRNDRWMGLLFIDLDNFKAINDAFGHVVGDKLLHDTAQRLMACLNGDSDMIARLSGDEFTLLLADCPPNENALQSASDMANRVLENLKQPFLLEDSELFVSASIGIALYPQDGQSVAELLKNAEAAGYDAKKRGRHHYQFFTHAMNSAAHKRLTLQNSLRRALEREELSLHYQPQWDTFTQQIVGVEALLRWKHPKLGAISPGEFIPLAEDCGLILPISEWVLHTACRQNKAWQERGFRPIKMAINLSAQQFYQGGLLQWIEKALQDSDLNASWLELEITETAAMSYAEKTVNMLHDLKKLGVSLAIDDFGTGYSSLSYLKQFAIDILKIDASFVADIHSSNGAALVSAIINMAHHLNLQVVAEGIENSQQLAFLLEQQCDFVQGFLFHHPVPADTMTALLQAHQG